MTDTAAVPIVLTVPPAPTPLATATRILWLLASLGSLGILGIASWLHPDPHGVETHTQLGLARCQFYAVTGIPCPGCGMTTSFAHFMHGHFLASLWVQPMGTALVIFTGCIFWIGLYLAISGRSPQRLTRRLPGMKILMASVVLLMLAWGWKIFIHVRHLDG